MSVEPRRECGYRKVGGIYICGKGIGLSCQYLPYIVERCPACDCGIKQSRGFTWIQPNLLFTKAQKCQQFNCPMLSHCPLMLDTKHGLLWTGEKFYPTPESFTAEAGKIGISKRIGAVPRNFQLGKTWIFLAHPKGALKEGHSVPAVFYVFKPERIEKIVTETDFKNAESMDKLKKQGITPVPVPDNDSDHRGTVYDVPKEQKKLDKYTGNPRISKAVSV